MEPAVSWGLLATRGPAGGAWHLGRPPLLLAIFRFDWCLAPIAPGLIRLIRLIGLIGLIGLLRRVLFGFVDLGRRSKVNLGSIHQGLAQGRMRVDRFG